MGLTAGLWRRSGQIATVVGLNWGDVLAQLPPDCDRERVLALLRCWEEGMLDGIGQRHKREEAERKAQEDFERENRRQPQE